MTSHNFCITTYFFFVMLHDKFEHSLMWDYLWDCRQDEKLYKYITHLISSGPSCATQNRHTEQASQAHQKTNPEWMRDDSDKWSEKEVRVIMALLLWMFFFFFLPGVLWEGQLQCAARGLFQPPWTRVGTKHHQHCHLMHTQTQRFITFGVMRTQPYYIQYISSIPSASFLQNPAKCDFWKFLYKWGSIPIKSDTWRWTWQGNTIISIQV